MLFDSSRKKKYHSIIYSSAQCEDDAENFQESHARYLFCTSMPSDVTPYSMNTPCDP